MIYDMYDNYDNYDFQRAGQQDSVLMTKVLLCISALQQKMSYYYLHTSIV